MEKLKKSLSVFLTLVMLFTTLCFFVLPEGSVKANAAADNVVICVPETIYMTPSTGASTTGEYYVNNTVDANGKVTLEKENSATSGKISIYAPDADSLTYKVVAVNGGKTGEPTVTDEGNKLNFSNSQHNSTFTLSIASGLPAGTTDMVKWEFVINFKNAPSATYYAYSTLYSPYVAPIGAAERIETYNSKIYLQSVAWISGVHGTVNNPYGTGDYWVAATEQTFSDDNEHTDKGVYYANGDDGNTGNNFRYFVPLLYGIENGPNTEAAAKDWFSASPSNNTLNIATIRYMNLKHGSSTTTYYRDLMVNQISQVAQLTIDTSRYDYLNEIPNLTVGYNITDSEGGSGDGGTFWYVSDFTDIANKYDKADNGTANFYNWTKQMKSGELSKNGYDKVWFNGTDAQGTVLKGSTTAKGEVTTGVEYDSIWNRSIVKNSAQYDYMFKASARVWRDEGTDANAYASLYVQLRATNVNKSTLRSTLQAALKKQAQYGVKDGFGSYLYDTTNEAWTKYVNAYEAANKALGNPTATASEVDSANTALSDAMVALDKNAARKVFFNVNYDGINPNLYVLGSGTKTSGGVTATVNTANETVIFNGTTTGNGYYFNTPFTPEEGTYTFSATKVSGSRSGGGCVVLESYNKNGNQLNSITGKDVDRRKLDISSGTASAAINYTAQLAQLTDLAYVWIWHNGAADATAGVYNNLEMQFKIEKGGTKTAYSPAARITDSDGTYPTLPVLSRQGYDFLGWYADEGLTKQVTDKTDFAGDTLYAKWRLAQFKVSFDTILDLATWDISGKAGAERIGNTGIALTNKNTNGEYTLESPSFPVTAGKEYYINVDASPNGGSAHYWDVYIFFYNANNSQVYVGDAASFSDSAQHFADDGRGTPSRTFKAPTGAVKAKIRLDSNTPGVTVNFDNIRVIEKGRAVSGASYVPSQTVTYTEAYGTLPTPTREGYTFAGWSDANGNKVTSDSKHNILGNTVLYSEWNVLKYDLTWEDGSGQIITREEAVPYGTAITPPADPSRTAYTFAGWESYPATMPAGNLTIKAKWTPVTYTVSYNTDGGTLAGATSQNYNIESGVTLNPNTPVKAGYTFAGWTVESNDGDWAGSFTAGQSIEKKYGNVTLKAVWTENTYTVTYNTEGGSITGSTSVGYDISDTVTVPVPVKTGYNFKGWTVSGSDHNWNASYNGGEQLTGKYGNVTFTAAWEKKTYKVTFTNPEDQSFEAVEIGVKFEDAPSYSGATPKKAETAQYTYEFTGWKNTSTGKVIPKDKLGEEKITADTAYTAVFTEVAKTFTVTFTYNVSSTETKTITVTGVAYNTLASSIIPAEYTKGYPEATNGFTHTHWIASTNVPAGTRVVNDMSFTATYNLSGNITLSEEAPDHNPATCTEPGRVSLICSGCGYAHAQPQAALGHTADRGIVTLEATCLEKGEMTFECSRCGDWRIEDIDALGHSFSDVPAKDATCASRGWDAHRECVRCRNLFPTGSDNFAKVIPGYTPYITVNHTVDENAPATCTAPQICTVCNQIVNPRLEHILKDTYEYPAGVTCTSAGTYYIVTTCERGCEYSKTTTMYGTKPHSFTYSETVGATCTEEGYDLYVCTTCPSGNPAEEHRNAVPELGHEPGAWVTIEASTCTEAGSQQRSCTRCHEIIETKELPLADHNIEEVTITPADCTNDGLKKYECTECHFVESEEIIYSLGHLYGDRATCEKASVCLREGCGAILEPALDHAWDNGEIIKEATETEEGIRLFTCRRDETHTKEVAIPVRVVIEVLPGVSADATLVIKAGEDGFAGNINDLVRVEEGIPYTVIVDDPGVISVNSNGDMIAVGDGETIITVITKDGKYKKSFAVSVKLLKTITFDVNGRKEVIRAYIGEAFEPISVDAYVDENGFPRTFTHWTMNGAQVSEFICSGDMYLTAQFTSSCKYGEFDALSAKLREVLNAGGNADLIEANQAKIDSALALIEEFSKDRDKRTADKQYLIDAAAAQLSATIISIYPDKNTSVEIRAAAECTAGTYVEVAAYLMPVDVPVDDVVWSTTDRTVGFIAGGRFYAVRPGVVTLRASRGAATAEHTITVNKTAGGRVIFFDTVLYNARYIVEGAYIVETSTNIFWSPYEDVHFRVATEQEYDEYGVYLNNVRIYPAADGTYTIPANTGDAHIRMVGFDNEDTGDGEGGNDNSTVEKLSFWDMIRNFFKKIGDFFRNLFGG